MSPTTKNDVWVEKCMLKFSGNSNCKNKIAQETVF